MKGQFVRRRLLNTIFFLVFLGASLTLVVVVLHWDGGEPSIHPQAESARANDETSTHKIKKQLENIPHRNKSIPDHCGGCSKLIDKVVGDFSLNWTKNEENHQKLRSLLFTSCDGFQKAIVTQKNSPMGTTISYDGEKRNRSVTPDLFNNFPKDMPFSDKILDTCAVVGNGGILANSSCGEAIDSAHFVIRCNLPPLEYGYSKHVGTKTSLVTANPSIIINNGGDTSTVHPQTESTRAYSSHRSKLTDKVLGNFSLNWTKNEENHQKLRFLLINNSNGFQKAFMTQKNSPVGTKISYDGEKIYRIVTPDLFNTFTKGMPFSDKILDTCAVVGNGGILGNSLCGEAIDSAQFVIRCNLPPLEEGYRKHVGNKTSLVTANPSIFIDKYGGLKSRRREFVDNVRIYGDSLMILPAFSFAACTDVSMVVHHTLEDSRSSVKSVFLNPDYIRRLCAFWESQGLKTNRMSTGFMMVNLALEICNDVEVYGFWPFDNHPFDFQPLTNHYYDNIKPKKGVHAMPAEFGHLVKLHNQGVLRLHLGQCPLQK